MSKKEVIFDDAVNYTDEGVDNYDEEFTDNEELDLQEAELDTLYPKERLVIMCKYRDGSVFIKPIGAGVRMAHINPRHKGLAPTKVYVPEELRDRSGINVFLDNCDGAEIIYGDTN